MQHLEQAAVLATTLYQSPAAEDEGATLKAVISIADILARLGLDWQVLTTALLYPAVAGEQIEVVEVEQQFGDSVAGMVRDMARIASFEHTPLKTTGALADGHIENLRRMILSIADDIRVVLVVLATRLHQLRELKGAPVARQQRVAGEIEAIYAPLANRLGIWQIKWELEDLCLRYLHPDEYKEIASKLDGRRAEREASINEVMAQLNQRFADIGITAEITGRPKHIYSIWKKMRRKGVDFEQIFDLRAVRVLVQNVAECYAALGVVHGVWRHIPGEFDDYIATPKSNMYRSIHTAVIGPGDKPLEIQIRTHDMHDHAELGVAAHWRYKEPGRRDNEFERRVLLMRNWLELKDASGEPGGNDNDLESEFEASQVYLLTPHGKVVELPKGATAIDFAYYIHSSIGDRCRGVRIDGHIAPLSQPLESGQVVEIITAKTGGPSRDWLSPHLGYTRTSKAKNRIRHWFKQQDYEAHIGAGRAALEREITRLGAPRPDLESLLKRFNLLKVDDLLAAIGRGDISPVQVAGTGVVRELPVARDDGEAPRRQSRPRPVSGGSEVVVDGVGDLMTHMARCSKPVPYDRVVGFITRGRGVTVHRDDCSMVRHLTGDDRQRLVEVTWAERNSEQRYPVDIRVLASDRKGLLRDISSIFTSEEVDLIGVNTQSDRKTDRARMRFTVEIRDISQLSRLLGKVAQLPDVLEVQRQL